MSKALVVSRNLVSDSLYIQPAVKKWQSEHPDWQLDLLTHKNYIAVLYYGMDINWHQVFFEDSEQTDASQYDSKFLLGAGDAGKLANEKRCHIAEAYADMMGVQLDEPIIETPFGKFRAIKPYFEAWGALSHDIMTGHDCKWSGYGCAELFDGKAIGWNKDFHPMLWSPF